MNGLIFGGQLEDLGLEFDPSLVSMRRSSGGHKIATFLRKNGYDIDVAARFSELRNRIERHCILLYAVSSGLRCILLLTLRCSMNSSLSYTSSSYM